MSVAAISLLQFYAFFREITHFSTQLNVTRPTVTKITDTPDTYCYTFQKKNYMTSKLLILENVEQETIAKIEGKSTTSFLLFFYYSQTFFHYLLYYYVTFLIFCIQIALFFNVGSPEQAFRALLQSMLDCKGLVNIIPCNKRISEQLELTR